MDTVEFLSYVLPESGPYLLGFKTDTSFRHVTANTIDIAAHTAISIDASGRDTYFAIGSIKNAQTLREIRSKNNISHIKAFIVDLDIDANNDKKYPSKQAAVIALSAFCKAVALPIPLVVCSGYGIHAYWVLTKAIPAELWAKLAGQIKKLAAAHNFLADPARTADCSSVLRVVGTHNFKYGASQPVYVISPTTPTPIPPIAFAKLLLGPELSTAPSTPSDIGAGLGNFDTAKKPPKLAPIVRNCHQMAAICKVQGNVEEPLWYAAIQLMYHTEEGLRGIQFFSSGHPDYSPEATERKVAQLEKKAVGPTLCERFNALAPGICTACAYFERLKSPISLGYTPDITPACVPEEAAAFGQPPFPFVRTVEGKVVMTQHDPQGVPLTPVVVLDTDIYPIQRIWEDGEERVTWRAFTPREGWRTFDTPARFLYSTTDLIAALSNEGIYPDLNNLKLVNMYLQGYAQLAQKHITREITHSQMGFSEHGFVLGNVFMQPNKPTQHARLNANVEKVAADNFGTAGSLDVWKSIINIYTRPGMEEYAFALMIGFGALFMRYSEYNGAIYNLVGESGVGKSTLLRLIHSIYGKPKESALLQNDTSNAAAVILSCYNNIPATYDEITNIEPGALSQLTYSVTNGRDKRSLTSDRTIRQTDGGWRLSLFSTSNRSLFQILEARGTDHDGEKRRIMERRISHSPIESLAEARTLFAPLWENYGHAGPPIIQWLLNNDATAKAMYTRAEQDITSSCSGAPAERFWVMFCALAICGAELGAQLHLHNYSIEQTKAYALYILQSMRETQETHQRTSSDILGDFLTSSVRSTLIISDRGTVITTPVSDLTIRLDYEAKKVYVAKHAFNKYCADHRTDTEALLAELKQRHALLSRNTRMILGEKSALRMGMVNCYVFDLANVLISGKPSLVKSNAETTTNSKKELG